MSTATPLPRVTPFLLRDADTMCARRLRRHWQGLRGDEGEMTRGRVRDGLVDDARSAHQEMGPPHPDSFSVRPDLLPEEQEVQRRAARHYLDLFGEQPFQTLRHDDLERPTPSDKGFEVGGWIDLVGRRPDGTLELRQFEVWGRPPVADPARNTTVLLAALRIRRALAADRLVVRHADLLHGRLDEHETDFSGLGADFSRRLARIRLRVNDGTPTAGQGCVTCPFVQGCPALAA